MPDADFFLEEHPADIDAVAAGAAEIRSTRKLLNVAMNRFFSALTTSSWTFLDKWVLGAMIANDASVDANRAINTNHIKDGAVTSAKLATSAITADSIGPATVTRPKIHDKAVGDIFNRTTAKTTLATTDSVVIQDSEQAVVSQTSGTLTVGNNYIVTKKLGTDNFTGTGYVSDGVVFTALDTGGGNCTPPTWTNSTEVTDVGKTKLITVPNFRKAVAARRFQTSIVNLGGAGGANFRCPLELVRPQSTTYGATDGKLTAGRTYTMVLYAAGDDFTNVAGTAAPANGSSFVCLATAQPTQWGHGSILYGDNIVTLNGLQSSGSLIKGQSYIIGTIGAGDNFSNVNGGVPPSSGVPFTATGTGTTGSPVKPTTWADTRVFRSGILKPQFLTSGLFVGKTFVVAKTVSGDNFASFGYGADNVPFDSNGAVMTTQWQSHSQLFISAVDIFGYDTGTYGLLPVGPANTVAGWTRINFVDEAGDPFSLRDPFYSVYASSGLGLGLGVQDNPSDSYTVTDKTTEGFTFVSTIGTPTPAAKTWLIQVITSRDEQ